MSWDEALDYVAGRLSGVRETPRGPEALVFPTGAVRSGIITGAFLQLGTPNYCNHDTSCAGTYSTPVCPSPAWAAKWCMI
ncbi:MAG: hypothetical protein R2860_15570 [Desulfobacterales bacterium]